MMFFLIEKMLVCMFVISLSVKFLFVCFCLFVCFLNLAGVAGV